MEKEKKERKLLKCVGWTILSYLLLSLIAAVCSFVRVATQGEDGEQISGFMILELCLVPVLFLIAGYYGSAKFEFNRMKTARVLLFATGFSLLLLLLWYVFMEAYVLLNLPAAEGSYALDLALRKTILVRDYEVLFLANTDGYRYAVLPLIHFGFRVMHWLFYLWGNRWYVGKQNPGKAKKKRK